MSIILVAAMDRNRGIGNKNKLPWGNPIPEDMANFKRLTIRENVVMGRKTWESIRKKYRPLPKRKENIVLTRDKNFIAEGATVLSNIYDILCRAENEDFYVIGGSEIYKEFLPHATKMYTTFVDGEFECDAHFPEYDHFLACDITTEHLRKDESNQFALRFATLIFL